MSDTDPAEQRRREAEDLADAARRQSRAEGHQEHLLRVALDVAGGKRKKK